MEKFHSTRRIEVITRQRRNQNTLKMGKKTGFPSVTMSYHPLKRQPALSSLANLKSLVIEDMDLNKDQVHKGYARFIAANKILILYLSICVDISSRVLYLATLMSM